MRNEVTMYQLILFHKPNKKWEVRRRLTISFLKPNTHFSFHSQTPSVNTHRVLNPAVYHQVWWSKWDENNYQKPSAGFKKRSTQNNSQENSQTGRGKFLSTVHSPQFQNSDGLNWTLDISGETIQCGNSPQESKDKTPQSIAVNNRPSCKGIWRVP